MIAIQPANNLLERTRALFNIRSGYSDIKAMEILGKQPNNAQVRVHGERPIPKSQLVQNYSAFQLTRLSNGELEAIRKTPYRGVLAIPGLVI